MFDQDLKIAKSQMLRYEKTVEQKLNKIDQLHKKLEELEKI